MCALSNVQMDLRWESQRKREAIRARKGLNDCRPPRAHRSRPRDRHLLRFRRLPKQGMNARGNSPPTGGSLRAPKPDLPASIRRPLRRWRRASGRRLVADSGQFRRRSREAPPLELAKRSSNAGSSPTTTARPARPRAWETERGTIETSRLYPGDAPLGVEEFVRDHGIGIDRRHASSCGVVLRLRGSGEETTFLARIAFARKKPEPRTHTGESCVGVSRSRHGNAGLHIGKRRAAARTKADFHGAPGT